MDSVARARGFTLIEILVVLVVIGITVALITPNLSPAPERALREEIERISALVAAAHDEAITRNETLAWSVEDGQLRFWQRAVQTREWQAVADPAFRPRTLDASLTDLRIGNARAEPQSKIVLAPDGVQPAYEARFERAGLDASLAADVLGQLRITTP